MVDAIDNLITNLNNEKYSLSNQNVRCHIEVLVLALEEIQGGLVPSGVITRNLVYAGPATNPAALPTFRALVSADLPIASLVAPGAVEPDGTTITILGGVISATGGASGSNPTAVANPVSATNGVATTFMRSDAAPKVALNATTNSLGANVALNNTANYFDGPQVAQGTTGTWFVSGSVVIADTTSIGPFFAKLWDGTTVIASMVYNLAVGTNGIIALSGVISAPAGNLRISVRDSGSISGNILFNSSGNSKDSVITAVRIS